MKTLEQCKEEIAKQNFFKSWLHMSEFAPPYKFEQAITQAAERYAESKVQQAIHIKEPTEEEINLAIYAYLGVNPYSKQAQDAKIFLCWYKSQIQPKT